MTGLGCLHVPWTRMHLGETSMPHLCGVGGQYFTIGTSGGKGDTHVQLPGMPLAPYSSPHCPFAPAVSPVVTVSEENVTAGMPMAFPSCPMLMPAKPPTFHVVPMVRVVVKVYKEPAPTYAGPRYSLQVTDSVLSTVRSLQLCAPDGVVQ